MSTIYTPRKVIYAPNDPFFKEGNIALKSLWLQKEARSKEEIKAIQEEAYQLVEKCSIEIYCDQCRIKFPNVSAYERHYEAIHRNVCLECHKIFPGTEWLKLHIDEYHNMFLKIKRTQGEKIYRCFVSSCLKSFSTQHKRQLHLIYKHRYPADFPFDLVKTGTLSFKERMIKNQKMKQRQEKKRAEQAKTEGMEVDKQHDSRTSRRMDVDTAMEDLSTSMAKLSLPKSISFGRRPPAMYHATNVHPATTSRVAQKEPQPEIQQDVEMKTRKPRKRGPKKKKGNHALQENV